MLYESSGDNISELKKPWQDLILSKMKTTENFWKIRQSFLLKILKFWSKWKIYFLMNNGGLFSPKMGKFSKYEMCCLNEV